MKINNKKANKIKGLFATLNKIELDNAIAKQDRNRLTNPEYVSFECDIKYNEIFKGFYCELSSQKMTRKMSWMINKYTYMSDLAFGGHWATTQTLWDDVCSYSEFRYVVEFARKAIKSKGTSFMEYASHKVTADMPDYLNFETKQSG